MYSFRERSTETELMDRPDADEAKLLRTVRQFRTINFLFSRSRTLLKRYVIEPVLARGESHVSLLDVGAGGCEIAAWLAARLSRLGVSSEIICLDADPRISRMARRRYRHMDQLRVVTGTASDLPADFRVDYAFSNHTLHHLTNHEITGLYSWLAHHVDRAFIMNDLHRSRLSHTLYSAAAWLFFHDTFSLVDGRISIRRGFRPAELEALAARSDLGCSTTFRTEVRKLVPGRVAVVGRRESAG